MTKGIHNGIRQRGVALVIGLILLTVLTLLAVAGMNSASLQVLMVGNEQYRMNAFNAAQTGISLATQTLLTTPNPPNIGNPIIVNTTPVSAANPSDQYSSTTAYLTCNEFVPAVNSSVKKFNVGSYRITSTGTSPRNATSTQDQGIGIVQPGQCAP